MKININFASRKYLIFRKVYAVFLAALVLGAALFALEYHQFSVASSREAMLERRLETQERVHQDIMRKVSELKKEVPAGGIKALSQQADFANAAIARKAFSWTAFLNRLEAVTPDGVGITTINPDFESFNIDISGSALSMSQAMEFVDRLTKSEYFEDVPPLVHISETVADKDIGKTLQSFNLKIRYNPEGRKAGADGREKKS